MRSWSRYSLIGAVATLSIVLAQLALAAPKTALRPIPADLRAPLSWSAESAGGCQTLQYDNDEPAYAWISPDEYGDTMQFVRFTPAFTCTLKTVQFWVGDTALGMVGTPDVVVDIYSEAGGFPDALIASDTVPHGNLVFYPSGPVTVDFSSLGLTFDKDFCVVLHRGGTVDDTVAFISDDGSAGTLRSGEFYIDAWELMVDGWGLDVNFFVRTEVCCGDPPACTPGGQASWPTYGGSYGRTFRSAAGLGNECQLSLDWITQGDTAASPIASVSPFTNVIVADTLAFLSFWNYLSCFDVRTGDTIWTHRSAFPDLGEDMRCNVTVDDSLVYTGGGTFRSFNCLRVADGSLVWSYNTTSTPAPLGQTRFAPSVIKDSVIYYGNEYTGRQLWALNKYTGTLYSGWPTNPVVLPEGGVYNALASDGDSLLFVGTVGENSTLTDGRLYAVRLADGSIKWELEDPSAIYLDPTLDREGFSGSLAYEDGILYYQSNIRDDGAEFDHFPWDGSCGAIDVNLEDGTGAGILWVSGQPVGRALYGGPVVSEGVVYVGNDGIFVGDANPKGVIALNKANGSRIWHNPLDGAGVFMPLTITCEAAGNPYLFAGTRGGLWFLLDAFTGAELWSRTFSGVVHGTVVLDSQVLVSTRNSLLGSGNGQLASFRVTGVDRPRMEVQQLSPFSTNALPGTGNGTVDTIYDALLNTGCADLVLTSFGVDTVSLAARITAVEPMLAARANRLAQRMAPDYLSFVDAFPAGPSVFDRKHGLLRDGLDDESMLAGTTVRRWTRRATATASGQVVTVETVTPATVAAGGALDIALRIDETGQTPRTSTRNYVVLNSNDPDFFPEDTAYGTFGSPVIPVDAIFGYAREQDTLRANDALSLVTNHGSMGNGDDELFYVEGDNTASLFDATFIVSGKIDNTVRTAFDVYDWEEFQPDTFLTIAYDTSLGTFTGSDTITGTYATSKYVDSIGFPDSAQTYAFGVEVRETQVGFNLVGEDITSFKLIQYCVINRNATPVDSVIYLGNFFDWDIASGFNNVDTTWATERGAVFEYDPSSGTEIYGVVKLPQPGKSYRERDSQVKTASPFYSVYAVYNPDEVYPSGAFYPIVDSIHGYLSRPGYNSRGGFDRDDDMSMAVVLDTVHLDAFDTVYVRCAVFGETNVADFDSEVHDAVFGSNLVAGFQRGDVNADGRYNFLDLVRLYRWVNSGGTTAGLVPRTEQGDVNADGAVDMNDVDYLEAFLYGDGPQPIGKWWW